MYDSDVCFKEVMEYSTHSISILTNITILPKLDTR